MPFTPIFALLGLNIGGYTFPNGFSGAYLQAGTSIDAKYDFNFEFSAGKFRRTGASYDFTRSGMNFAAIAGIAPFAGKQEDRGLILFAGPSVQTAKGFNSADSYDFGVGIDAGIRSHWGRTSGWFVGVDWVRYHKAIFYTTNQELSYVSIGSIGFGYAF